MFEKYVYLTLIKGGQEKNKFLLLGALNGRHIGAMWLSFIGLPVKNMLKWYIIIIINWVFFWTCY